ncbi:sulfurtransferase [Cupriavidus sp. D384]|uniref:sulfurtransferase n=1 Tax=Cupriavidus sp. D384 TaxID=1538095 RepID=UPI0009EF3AAD|nr:rhodanese-like domain-containing protein [Cupriavidus sp. D384]
MPLSREAPPPDYSVALVSAEALLNSPTPNRLFIDVRLGDPAAELSNYQDCHIYGAVYAQIRDVFAGLPTQLSGNLPLPNLVDLNQELAVWGVGIDTEIVVYGPSPALAARGWWVLRWAGLTKVRVLDGGLKAWISAGGPVARGTASPRPTTAPLLLGGGHLAQIDAKNLLAVLESDSAAPLLIDARNEDAYQAGHIRGARNIPASSLWTPSGTLRGPEALTRQLSDVGADDVHQVIIYCGGGVLSALTYLVLEQTRTTKPTPLLYVGSWSEWIKEPARLQLTRSGSAA